MEWIINYDNQQRLAEKLGCTFCEDGIFAEMALELSGYAEKTRPINDIRFDFYHGDIKRLHESVAAVDKDWVQYFDEDTTVFCGFSGETPVSFCIIDTNIDYILSVGNKRVGAVGCVGTIPTYRSRGIGLRMVDLATLYLKENGCDLSTISYTHIDKWYGRLGYETFARFSFRAEHLGS